MDCCLSTYFTDRLLILPTWPRPAKNRDSIAALSGRIPVLKRVAACNVANEVFTFCQSKTTSTVTKMILAREIRGCLRKRPENPNASGRDATRPGWHPDNGDLPQPTCPESWRLPKTSAFAAISSRNAARAAERHSIGGRSIAPQRDGRGNHRPRQALCTRRRPDVSTCTILATLCRPCTTLPPGAAASQSNSPSCAGALVGALVAVGLAAARPVPLATGERGGTNRSVRS